MAKTRIFLSSTCYDLRAHREHLREKIQEFGHEVLASEFSSFPVSPDLSTIENCRKVVRDHADLFVLIVGGKRGSLDESGERSVVNAEYMEAMGQGLGIFVFVDKQVWDLLPIYQKNPNADFSPVVDNPQVFKFVSDLRADSRWVYTFAKTEEIIETLRTQLSIFLRTLIERGRAGTLVVPKEFACDPQKVITLLQERPAFWEHLLTCELLELVLASGRKRLAELDKNLIYRRIETIQDNVAFDRLSGLFRNVLNIARAFQPAVREIVPAWGPLGVAGNPVEIREACQRVADLIEALVDWETELRFLEVSKIFMPLFESLRGSTKEFIDEIARMPVEIRKGIELAQTTSGIHQLRIDLTIRSPATLTRFNNELAALQEKLAI
jgi:hypothetical protein